MTLETCDLWDIWLDRFWKIFRFLDDFQIFRRFSYFWNIFRFLDNPRTCDIWDTDYNSDNWEPEFMTIFVIWQLIVTLDSIRNSCDVFLTPPLLRIFSSIFTWLWQPITQVKNLQNSKTTTFSESSGRQLSHGIPCLGHTSGKHWENCVFVSRVFIKNRAFQQGALYRT